MPPLVLDLAMPSIASVRTKATKALRLEEADYAVSPSTPLLSTNISENSYICGSNSSGQLGIAGTSQLAEPQLIQGAGKWAALAFGSRHAAGLTGNGQLYSWGTNSSGQLGQGSLGCCLPVPAKLDTSEQGFRVVACGDEHTIVATSNSVLSCGSNHRGQLGLGEAGMQQSQCCGLLPVPGLQNIAVVQVACGSAFTICLTAQSQVFAWGANSAGQLGLGDRRDRCAPELIDALWALPVAQLAAGSSHSLALTTSGNVFSWGSNDCGQLGVLPDAEHAADTYISPAKGQRGNGQRGAGARRGAPGASARATAGQQALLMSMLEMGIPRPHAELALQETGSVGVEVATEWLFSLTDHVLNQHLEERAGCGQGGEGGAAASGSGAPRDEVRVALEPRRVPVTNVRFIAAGRFHTSAVSDSGVFCWGDNSSGQLGLGDNEDRDLPTQVTALDEQRISRVSCGASHTLFLTISGSVFGCGECSSGQLTHRAAQMGEQRSISLPVKLALPFGVQRSRDTHCKAPVVHEVVAGPYITAFITRSPDELPEVQHVKLLHRLQAAIGRMAAHRRAGSATSDFGRSGDDPDVPGLFKAVSAGVDVIFSSPAALSAAFGRTHGMGIDVQLLDQVQQSILNLYTCEEQTSSSSGSMGAELHKFSICQTMYRAASTLLDDLSAHSKLLGGPERAQVLLAAFQHPLLADHAFAKMLVPRLGAIFMNAPTPTRKLMVKWWSECPPQILLDRVVVPLQAFLTKELMATKKLTVSVMNAIKVLAKAEEANQIGRGLPPDAFYNQLISEKMDVQDHYTAWRQTHDMPPAKRLGSDGPFSFCSYPFLLDPRAKSNLLHIEARFQMEQTVAHARMEQQLHGGVSRRSEADSALVLVKPLMRAGSSSGPSSSGSSSGGTSRGKNKEKGLRGLILNLFRSSSSRSSRSDTERLRDQVSVDSFSLPIPSRCTMPGTHSDMCIVRVRRNHLVEDALSEISRQLKRDLFKPLRVHFIGEEGIDAGGVKKEFFQLLVTQLLSPDYGMLKYQAESNTYWFDPNSMEGEEQYMLMGLVLGLAVYNRVLLDFPLPIALYKKLLGLPVGLRDLEDMQPTFGRSLRQLLQYDGPAGTLEETFCINFSFEVEAYGHRRLVELVPHGDQIAVNEENRIEYVEALADYLLNKSIARQFSAFSEGFRILCDGPATRLFNAQELERLVCGNPSLDFDALQQNAKYEGGYHAQTPVVQWLWDIVRNELALEEKRKFLKFFTGSDRSPIGGLGTLRCILQRNGCDSSKLPTSHTCFNTLLLPEYISREKLLHLLRVAITCCTGFGLE